jgi:hypothetical protein
MTEAKLKVLVSRVMEANSLRELLDSEKLEEACAELPHLVETLRESVACNTLRFEQNHVQPHPVSRLSQVNQIIDNARDSELEHIVNTVLFVMEHEIFKISKKILEIIQK